MIYLSKNRIVLSVIFIINVVAPLTCSVAATITEDLFGSDNAKKLIRLSKSADIKSFMDTSIDPCNDFYAFACGTWKRINSAEKSNVISTDKFQTITKGIERKLSNLLLKNSTGDGNVEDKIKDFYSSCLNAKKDNVKYRLAMENVCREFGQFSVLKTNKEKHDTNFSWWSTVANIKNKYGKSIILSVDILDHLKEKSKTMVYIGPPAFQISRAAANDRISKFLKLYLRIEEQDATRLSKEIINFERYLIKGATDQRLGKSIEELTTLYNTTVLIENYKSLFDFREFLEIVLGTKALPPQVYVFDESYLEGLHDVFNTTDEEQVENYILWLLLDEYIIDITSNDVENECMDKSKEYFGKFVDHAIYNQYRSKEQEDEIYELWDDIKSTFKHDLDSSKYYWISNATRQYAIEKLNNMNLSINSYDNDNFIELFKSLKVNAFDYVVNVQNILEHAESLRQDKLEKQSAEDSQVMSFTPVYNLFENQIKIPVALLQPRFVWDRNYPKAIQYSTLGFLIAHEMIHGFDDEGRKYDANGNARNWWDEKSTYEFESRRKCFQQQYHSYSYDGELLPEISLQSENIADNAGVNIAYNAYLRWLEKRKQTEVDVEANETLPRLDFNNRQLFFISFAQIWCEDIHSAYRSQLAYQDIHAPAMYRVIGSLSNSREFSWIFKCNNNSHMDPPKKCEIY